MGETKRLGHVRIHFASNVLEIVEMLIGKDDRLQLVRRAGAPFNHRWHQVHLRLLRLRSDWRDRIPTLKIEKKSGPFVNGPE